MKTPKSIRTQQASSPHESPSSTFTTELQQLTAILQVLRRPAADTPPPAVNTEPQPMDAEWAQHVVDALLKRLYRRVPKPGNKKLARRPEFCPFSGLNHSQIYQGMEHHADGRPPIRSVSLKEPDEASAARFYSVQSALEYMDYLAHLQEPSVKPVKR